MRHSILRGVRHVQTPAHQDSRHATCYSTHVTHHVRQAHRPRSIYKIDHWTAASALQSAMSRHVVAYVSMHPLRSTGSRASTAPSQVCLNKFSLKLELGDRQSKTFEFHSDSCLDIFVCNFVEQRRLRTNQIIVIVCFFLSVAYSWALSLTICHRAVIVRMVVCLMH